ncbi:MAG: hypothetical protein R2729_27990 [Bryobacteraceae bacterium]
MKINGPGKPNIPPPLDAATKPGATPAQAWGAQAAQQTVAAAPAWAAEVRATYRRADMDDPVKSAEMVGRLAKGLVEADPSAAALDPAGRSRVASFIANDPLMSAALRKQLERVLT